VAIAIGEAAGADMVPGPAVVPAMLTPAATEVADVPAGERPAAASVGVADVPAPSVSEEVGVDARSAQPGGSLVAVRRSPEAGASCSDSGPARPRTLSSFSTMNRRTCPGMSSASVPKQR
jgi:hypothetical protein